MVWRCATLWGSLDIIRIKRKDQHHLDLFRLLALFRHGQPECHSMSHISVCSCKPIPRICKHVVQKWINFVVLLFKVKVSISIDMPCLHFMMMTWSYVNQFLTCSHIFNNMTNTEVTYPNSKAQLESCSLPVHFLWWLTSWNYPTGMMCCHAWWLYLVASHTWQKAFTCSVTV
jgi:hypothetical protein